MADDINRTIRAELLGMRDEKYASFQAKLIPGIDPKAVIGVRTPQLRAYAKKLVKEEGVAPFLNVLPHECFDEMQLHAFITSEMKDFDGCLAEVNRFLPYVDNWATCDQLSPKVFGKHKEQLLPQIKIWMSSTRTYTIRFGIEMLMQHYLDNEFKAEYPQMVAEIRSDEYYVNMMIAWYFATALAKQYQAVLPFIEDRKLEPWTHNKAIQKAVESYRITDAQKEYLKTLKCTKGEK